MNHLQFLSLLGVPNEKGSNQERIRLFLRQQERLRNHFERSRTYCFIFPAFIKKPEFINGHVEIWHWFRLTPEVMGEKRTLHPNSLLTRNRRGLFVLADEMGPLHAVLLRDALTQVIESSEIEYSDVPDPE